MATSGTIAKEVEPVSARRRLALWSGLTVYTLLGAASLARPNDGASFRTDDGGWRGGELATELIAGAVAALGVLALIGSLRYGWSRLRKREPTWYAKTLAFGTMAIALGLLILSAAGRAASEQEQATRPGTADTGSASKEWEEEMQRIGVDLATSLQSHAAFISSVRERWDSKRVALVPVAQKAQNEFERSLAKVRAAPENSSEEERVNRMLEQGLVEISSAYDDYLDGIAAGDLRRMEAGDRAYSRGEDQLVRARSSADRLLGPPASPAQRELRALSDRFLTIKPTLTRAQKQDTLFFRQWQDDAVSVETARATAARAHRLYASVVTLLEATEKPQTQPAAGLLKNTTAGYRFVVAAFDDYLRAIDTGTGGLLASGDRKHSRGYRLVDEAVKDVAAYGVAAYGGED